MEGNPRGGSLSCVLVLTCRVICCCLEEGANRFPLYRRMASLKLYIPVYSAAETISITPHPCVLTTVNLSFIVKRTGKPADQICKNEDCSMTSNNVEHIPARTSS